jgi:hypothetical protein
MVSFQINGVTDPDGDAVSISITGVHGVVSINAVTDY